MNPIKIIKSEQEHEQALAYLLKLMNAGHGSAKADEIEELASLIERYEQEQFPLDTPNTIEAIRFRIEQLCF